MGEPLVMTLEDRKIILQRILQFIIQDDEKSGIFGYNMAYFAGFISYARHRIRIHMNFIAQYMIAEYEVTKKRPYCVTRLGRLIEINSG